MGKPLLIRLDEKERLTAELLGDGVASEGVRRALRATAIAGVDFIRTIAKGGKNV